VSACHVQAAFALALLAFAAFAGAQSPSPAQDEPLTREQAGEFFAARCASCHVAADPAFATDRAWIRQLADTA